jgi:hypothetical protein
MKRVHSNTKRVGGLGLDEQGPRRPSACVTSNFVRLLDSTITDVNAGFPWRGLVPLPGPRPDHVGAGRSCWR